MARLVVRNVSANAVVGDDNLAVVVAAQRLVVRRMLRVLVHEDAGEPRRLFGQPVGLLDAAEVYRRGTQRLPEIRLHHPILPLRLGSRLVVLAAHSANAQASSRSGHSPPKP